MWISSEKPFKNYVYFNTRNYKENNQKYATTNVNYKEKMPDGTKKYSSYFAMFLGEAYRKVSENPNIKSFLIKMAKFEHMPYINADGQKVYPKNTILKIFDIDEITYNDQSVSESSDYSYNDYSEDNPF